jgi:ABC-type transport system substrate-binding protein
LKLSTAPAIGYMGLTINVANDKNKGALSQSVKVRQALDLSIDREASIRSCSTASSSSAINGSASTIPIIKRHFRSNCDVTKAKALLKEADLGHRRSHGAAGRRERGRCAGPATGLGRGIDLNPDHALATSFASG